MVAPGASRAIISVMRCVRPVTIVALTWCSLFTMFMSASIARREVRRGLQHADDLDGLAVDSERLADDGRVAAEALLPVLVRQHHHRRGAGSVVAVAEGAPEHRREAHDREVVAGHEADVDAHRVALAHDGERERRVLGDAAQRLGATRGSL